jgi:hypothetical protein
MATNMTRKYSKTEVWPVVDGTVSGAAVVSSSASGRQPGVALTSEGGASRSETFGPYTISGIPSGGVGLLDNFATIAIDGAFRFNVTGASASTAVNTPVYAVLSGESVASLTLTASTNPPFGKIDRYIGESGTTDVSVWVGDYVDAT